MIYITKMNRRTRELAIWHSARYEALGVYSGLLPLAIRRSCIDKKTHSVRNGLYQESYTSMDAICRDLGREAKVHNCQMWGKK